MARPGRGGSQGAVSGRGAGEQGLGEAARRGARAGAAVRGVVDPMARECCTNLKQWKVEKLKSTGRCLTIISCWQITRTSFFMVDELHHPRRKEKVLFASLNYGSNLSFLPILENQKCLGPELTKPGMRPPGDRF